METIRSELPFDPAATTNQRKGCSDIVTSLPSVLPSEASLPTSGGLHRYEPVEFFQELLPGNAVLSTF